MLYGFRILIRQPLPLPRRRRAHAWNKFLGIPRHAGPDKGVVLDEGIGAVVVVFNDKLCANCGDVTLRNNNKLKIYNDYFIL